MNYELDTHSLYCVMRHDAPPRHHATTPPRHGTTHTRRRVRYCKSCRMRMLCILVVFDPSLKCVKYLHGCYVSAWQHPKTTTPDARRALPDAIRRLTSLHIAARFNRFAVCCWRVALVVELLDFAFGRTHNNKMPHKKML